MRRMGIEYMDRRELLQLAAGAALWTGLAPSRAGANEADELVGEPQPFSETFVRERAEALAGKQFAKAEISLPESLADLSYDQYRDIRFKANMAIWRGENRGFAVDLLHAGFYYRTPVEVFIVDDGQAWPVKYEPGMFDFGPSVSAPSEGTELPFSGFRLRHPLNDHGYWDEFAVFQGASYFRAIAEGQIYGLSARGLAIKTGSQDGEEFPVFRAFWIERPEPEARVVVIHALLDSPSTTGAYRFTVRPGTDTLVDVELVLFPRVELNHVGFGPLTSMFLFDSSNRADYDDFRPAVHDSDGLAMWNGSGEWLWRPLNNPETLQISAFMDSNPRGFGLMQRKRDFDQYQDLEAHYEQRPGAWVEPVGNWGAGHVELIEIPTKREIHDNIVAYWRPRAPLQSGAPYTLTYRLHWCNAIPLGERAATVAQTRSGLSLDGERRLFVVDFRSPNPLPETVVPEVGAGQGKVVNVVGRPNPETGGYRVSFELDTTGIDISEIRMRLLDGEEALGESWLYRWTR